MKHIVTFVAFVAFSFSLSTTAMAQASKVAPAPPDMVTMVNGKVMISREGKMTVLTSDFTSANGNIFKPDGTVVMNTGVTTTLQNGQTMGLDGKLREAVVPQNSKPAGAPKSN